MGPLFAAAAERRHSQLGNGWGGSSP